MIITNPDYDYTGWELAPECLVKVQQLLVDKQITKLDIVEFGSGKSTEVISKFKQENDLPGVFDTFDADPQYAHPLAKIHKIRSYDGRPVEFGNDYSFYDLVDADFSSYQYDLVLLDGHHGHGRSAAWMYLQGRLSSGCLVVIDDFDHYPLVEDFLKEFPRSREICKYWEPTKRWVIYEII